MLYAGPWVAERLAAVGDLASENPDAIHEVVRGIILGGRDRSARSAFQSFYHLAELCRAADAEWARMDVMLLPTAGTTYKIEDMLADPVRLNTNLGAYTNFVNLMDLAALSVPAGFRPDGLPFGVTLIGRAFSDGKLAVIGDALHRAVDGAKLGATTTSLAATPPVPVAQVMKKKTVQVAVVGAHLTGQPLNGQLVERDARLARHGSNRRRLPPLRARRHDRRRSRASCSTATVRAPSRSRSGRWTKRPSGRSWR